MRGARVEAEDERNAAPYGTAQYLQNEMRKSNDPKLGKVKATCRSGGGAAPKKDRKAKDKEKSNEGEPCICENCMSWETYKLYVSHDIQFSQIQGSASLPFSLSFALRSFFGAARPPLRPLPLPLPSCLALLASFRSMSKW